eukprot:1693181-Prymnesium_polylepis.1
MANGERRAARPSRGRRDPLRLAWDAEVMREAMRDRAGYGQGPCVWGGGRCAPYLLGETDMLHEEMPHVTSYLCTRVGSASAGLRSGSLQRTRAPYCKVRINVSGRAPYCRALKSTTPLQPLYENTTTSTEAGLYNTPLSALCSLVARDVARVQRTKLES